MLAESAAQCVCADFVNIALRIVDNLYGFVFFVADSALPSLHFRIIFTPHAPICQKKAVFYTKA